MLIIAHHCVFHGGAVNMDPCANKWIALLILPDGKLCFNAFLAISMWFLVDQEFRAECFLKLWLETLFYSVLFTIAAACGGIFDRQGYAGGVPAHHGERPRVCGGISGSICLYPLPECGQ